MFFIPTFDDMLTERIEEIAEFTPEQAEAVEFGALTIVGILSETASEVAEGNPEVETAIATLFDKANERIERVRLATVEAQVAEVEVEEEVETDDPYYDLFPDEEPLAEWERELLGLTDEEPQDDYVSPTKAVDDVIESMFAAFVGSEEAARIRAEVEANDRAKAETKGVSVEESLEQEVEDFLASLFGVRAA